MNSRLGAKWQPYTLSDQVSHHGWLDQKRTPEIELVRLYLLVQII